MEEAFPTKIPWLVDLVPWLVEHIPRFSQSLEFHNLCDNSIISCDLLFIIDPPIIGNKSLNYFLLQIFIIFPIFSKYSTKNK